MTSNQRIQRIAKSVAIFAKQKYTPLLPITDAYRWAKNAAMILIDYVS
jgi:hypothetical protein